MDDDSRLPPGRTLHLTLLDGAIHNRFTPQSPASGCGACHRPWKKHRRPQRGVPMCCQRCGIMFYDACYFERVATPRESVLFWAERHLGIPVSRQIRNALDDGPTDKWVLPALRKKYAGEVKRGSR